MIETALEYASRGWAVFPVKPNEKTPLTQHGCKDASNDPAKVEELFQKYPKANIGIATGEASGFWAFDVDVKAGAQGLQSLKRLQDEHGALPLTLSAQTPSHGQHLYFKCLANISNRTNVVAGIDVRGDGGYVVAPPSIIKRQKYLWLTQDEPIAEAPDWLIELVKGKTTEAVSQKIINGISKGERDNTIFRFACSLRARGFDYDKAKILVLQIADECSPPLPHIEAIKCLDSAWKYEPNFYLTDMGNSNRLVYQHGLDVRYVPEFKTWLTWDQTRWLFDSDGEVIRRAKGTALTIIEEARNEKDDGRRSALLKHAHASQNEKRVRAMVALAQCELPLSSAKLDGDEWIVNMQNGVIHLKTGQLMQPSRELYITKQVPIQHDSSAQCPLWLKFLDQIFDSDQELIGFVQRAVGYTLTGSTREQVLFFLHGTGANGKTVLLSVLLHLLGDYGTQARAETLMVNKFRDGSSASPDIARLRGTRLVSVSEVEEGQQFAESLVKQMTGSDLLTARYLYGKDFTFRPNFKIWLAGNHKPIIRGDDYAIWRRIRLIPFDVTIPSEQQDRELVSKLINEAPGILNWAIEGCQMWLADGLQPPDVVNMATNEYRQEMDVLRMFLNDRCILGADKHVAASALYECFKEWSEENIGWAMKQQKFGRKLREHGFRKERTARGNEYFGVGLLSNQYYDGTGI